MIVPTRSRGVCQNIRRPSAIPVPVASTGTWSLLNRRSPQQYWDEERVFVAK
ncbi:hypothetical protein HYDPIDRAFT_110525 [Hydnomerulius pinastri MD-312]|uniref:Uncharacterized protein n=1 Tax=Hydnomerulius pinastri MD-312 TaxID=994086 RepID=A0A0C2PQY4_9AGAM|nr:hypothetical protein HYDPIDRAFT_120604 [Hydnomerulius pinastri MD-312]KIJ65454.1 hypothetical protein HYDPIDRAFT_110525 [Hydnomerulius pinastri MD-312]